MGRTLRNEGSIIQARKDQDSPRLKVKENNQKTMMMKIMIDLIRFWVVKGDSECVINDLIILRIRKISYYNIASVLYNYIFILLCLVKML